MIPAIKDPALTREARGEVLAKLRCKYPANGSISAAAETIPQAGSQ
jgi:hypothetical protein